MITIIDFFEESVNKFSENIYLWEKKSGQYKGLTYKETQTEVYRFAAGLMVLGVEKGDRIALLSEGRNDWVISELGILYTGAVNVPLSVKLTEPSEIKFRLVHSGAKMVIASGNQLEKIRNIKNEIDKNLQIIVLDDIVNSEANEISYSEVKKMGDSFLSNHRNSFEERYRSVKPDDYANLCYTSGTTADPKGIILSHRNYTANVEQAYSLMTIPSYYKTLLILPWDHSFAHTAGLYCFMGKGASIASVEVGKSSMETLKNIPLNIKEIQPSLLLSVPSLAKNFRKNIEKAIRDKGKFTESLFNFALNIAYKYNGIGWDRGKDIKILLKPLVWLFDKILFAKVRLAFGGKLKFFIGGGALLDIELQRFFYAIGIPMYQGYGLSEASPIISSNSEFKHKLGSSGYLVNNLELKICDDDGNELPVGQKGEIVIKGENVMKGYWLNDEATSKTIKNGWLYTGDMGYLDNDGFLYVMGRFKSLLIADDGEKYSPEGIEEAFVNQSKIIDQCMLYNNQNPYTVALVVPNKEALKRYLKENNLDLNDEKTYVTACSLIENEIKEYRTGGKYQSMFPQKWLPSAIGILNEPFSEDNHMMNSTLKIVRGKIVEYYKQKIEYLYTPEAKNICNNINIEAIKKLLIS